MEPTYHLLRVLFVLAFSGVDFAFLVTEAMICWQLSRCLKAIPESHRQVTPWQVWLLMIPLFSFVWAFRVLPGIARSFESYFVSQGNCRVNDCGRILAILFCILFCCSVIPYVALLAFPAAVVVGITLLVKFANLKLQIQGTAFPVFTPRTH